MILYRNQSLEEKEVIRLRIGSTLWSIWNMQRTYPSRLHITKKHRLKDSYLNLWTFLYPGANDFTIKDRGTYSYDLR